MKIKDKAYLNWIRKLPCVLCNYLPKHCNYCVLITDKGNQYCNIPHNIAHHVGDGVHSRRYSDHWVVPLCDWHIYSGKATNNCHQEVHRHITKYDKLLRSKCVQYRSFYVKKYGDTFETI